MSTREKIEAAIKYYRENEAELKPVVEKTLEFFNALKQGRDVEAKELVTRFATVAALREKRLAVDELIRKRDAMADVISFLGLVVKLFAKGIQ